MKKYTVRDINKLMINSLFKHGGTLTEEEAFNIIKQDAMDNNIPVSKPLSKDFAFYLKSKR